MNDLYRTAVSTCCTSEHGISDRKPFVLDVVLDGDRTILREVFWGDLYQIGEGRLYRLVSFWLGSEKTLCKARERSNATDKNEHGESN